MSPRHVAAIIPFYQTEVGILRRAMLSIMDQALPANLAVHVFIINDSSPLLPDDDLSELPKRRDITFSVHHQENTGPGGARNLGLELSEVEQFDFVAFLDSDDSWHREHLSDAIQALDEGYGFYFCDNARDGLYESYNASLPVLQRLGAQLRSRATLISSEGPVLGFPRGALGAEMIDQCLCHTSCIVAKAEVLRARRFDADQRVAGEDHLLWINIFLDGPAIAISWCNNVTCVRGVNIFFSAFDCNLPQTLERLGHLLMLNEKLKRMPDAMATGSHHIKGAIKKYRLVYSYLFCRTILKGGRPGCDSLGKIVRLDAWLPLRMPFLFLRVAFDRRTKRELL